MKNKVLKHLDQYRDKTLSDGCMFDWCNEKMEQVTFVIAHIYGTEDIMTEVQGFSIYAYPKDDLHQQMASFDNPDDYEEQEATFFDYATIIGHPITHADLLRALRDTTCWTQWRMTLLEDKYQLNYHEVKVADRGSVTRMIIIPLNYPNVEAIPEDHPMWEQLGKVFNLTTPDHE